MNKWADALFNAKEGGEAFNRKTFIIKILTITRLRDWVNEKDWIPLLGDKWSSTRCVDQKVF